MKLQLDSGKDSDPLVDVLSSPLDLGAQSEYARSHWAAMRAILPTVFWTKTY